METPVAITIDLAKLIEATLPLFFGLFAGAWVLLRFMVFRPLMKISDDLEELKDLFYEDRSRIDVIETKLETLESQLKGGNEWT